MMPCAFVWLLRCQTALFQGLRVSSGRRMVAHCCRDSPSSPRASRLAIACLGVYKQAYKLTEEVQIRDKHSSFLLLLKFSFYYFK